jgi:hypothetical protein
MSTSQRSPIFPRFALGLTDRPIAKMPAYLAGSSSSSTDDGSHMYTFLDAVGAANNTCFGNPPCDPDCRHCDAYTHQCECLRWHINVPAKCKCPRLSSETLVAVGAVRRFAGISIRFFFSFFFSACHC